MYASRFRKRFLYISCFSKVNRCCLARHIINPIVKGIVVGINYSQTNNIGLKQQNKWWRKKTNNVTREMYLFKKNEKSVPNVIFYVVYTPL